MNVTLKGRSMNRTNRVESTYAFVSLVFVLANFAGQNVFGQAPSFLLASNAWICFEQKQYAIAISNSLECIKENEDEARAMQADMVKTNAVVPKGKVAPAIIDSIHANGILNDVGTCHFIIGECESKLASQGKSHIEEARKAYTNAREFTYARCWDTNGWFWAPTDKASLRLRKLPPP